MFCRHGELALLGRGDATARTAESAVGAQPYLDEHQCFCIAHDKVYLAEFTSVIAGNQTQAMLLQVYGCKLFSGVAQCLQVGICNLSG